MNPKILLIDNFDSFTFNLADYLQQAQAVVKVLRNDDPTLIDEAKQSDALVVSPGPSTPGNAGQSPQLVERFYPQKPILGVCLGMQIINEVFGGRTCRAPAPVHGKTATLSLVNPSPILQNLPGHFAAARYHSLVCTDIPDCLEISAVYQQIPMAFRLRDYPVYGVQFHPESFLTEYGHAIIQNFVDEVHASIT